MTAKIEIANFSRTFATVRATKGMQASNLLAGLQKKNVFHRAVIGISPTHLLEWSRLEGFKAYCADHGVEVERRR